MEELSGVMSLPEVQGPGMAPDQAAIFEQIRQNVPRQEITQELLSAGEQADPQAVAEFKQELAGLELTPDELNKLNTMVDAILAAPQDYASLRRAYLAEGMPEDLLPEQFDPAFFAALNMAIDTIAMNPASPPPMAMAGGGVASLAAYGRNGDTMLAHITPQEAAMLKRMGGAGTINPYTGLPEYASIFKKIGNAVKKFAKSTVGKIIIGAALGFFAGPAAASLLGVTSTAGMAAVSGFVGGAGSTLAAGGSLRDALKAGGLAALTAGAGAAITGGASAFEPRVFGGENANVFGFGQPEAAVSPTGAPPPGGALPSLTEMAPQTQASFLEANMAPQGYGTGTDGVLRMGPPPSASPEAIANYRRDQAMGSLFKPSPDANLVQNVMAPDTGSLTPADLAAPPASNTGAGTYRPGGDFTPRSSLSRPYSPLPTSGGTTGGGVMDTLRSGFDKTVDFFNPNAVGAEAQARAMQAGDAARNSAFENSYSKTLLSLGGDIDKLSPAQQSVLSRVAGNAGQAAYDAAYKAALPGTFARYAPLAALGVGALGAMGGFKPEQPQMPDLFKGPTGYQMYFADPRRFGLNFGGISSPSYSLYRPPGGYAEGGGVMDTPQAMRVGGKTYPRKIGAINGPGTGTSDSIPAMLSDGEFVFTAKAVRAMGNGSRRKGAKKMYKLMKMLEGKAA